MTNTAEIIKTWVAENFGQSEVDDPSWNIEALANYIDENQKPKLFMVVANYRNTIRENLEIVDYNLTYDEAVELRAKLLRDDDDINLDADKPVRIVAQCN